jgi:transposase
LQAELAVQGHRFSIGALWRFFARNGITWKKRLPTPRSRIGRMS